MTSADSLTCHQILLSMHNKFDGVIFQILRYVRPKGDQFEGTISIGIKHGKEYRRNTSTQVDSL